MLVQPYTSQPFPYLGGDGLGYLYGLTWYEGSVPNDVVGVNNIDINEELAEANNDLFYQFVVMDGSSKLRVYRFDSVTGLYCDGKPHLSNPWKTLNAGGFILGQLIQSAQGNIYVNAINLNPAHSGLTFMNLLTFEDTSGALTPASLFGLTAFNIVNLDESADILIHATGCTVTLYTLSTGAKQWDMIMPDVVVAITMNGSNLSYVLCQNRVLVLLDYTTNTILGAVRVPPSVSNQGDYINLNVGRPTLNICWYDPLGLLLISEVSGTDVHQPIVIRGYKLYTVPTRLTIPIPLQVPVVGTTIQVLTSVVDDLNQGLGGVVLETVLVGATLVGVPFADHKADTRNLAHIIGAAGALPTAPTAPVEPTPPTSPTTPTAPAPLVLTPLLVMANGAEGGPVTAQGGVGNGWGNNVQQGPYEGGQNQGLNYGFNNDTTYTYGNNLFALSDGHWGGFPTGPQSSWPTAYVEQTKVSMAFTAYHTHRYAGFICGPHPTDVSRTSPSSAAWTAQNGNQLWLNVFWVIPASTSSAPVTKRSASLYYSIDGGATFTMMANGPTSALGWTSILLPKLPGVDTGFQLSQLRLMGFVDSHDDMSQTIYTVALSTQAFKPISDAWHAAEAAYLAALATYTTQGTTYQQQYLAWQQADQAYQTAYGQYLVEQAAYQAALAAYNSGSGLLTVAINCTATIPDVPTSDN